MAFTSPTAAVYKVIVDRRKSEAEAEKQRIFEENAKWMAFERSSLQWPKAWRAVIYKIARKHDVFTRDDYFQVIPHNPAYLEYMNNADMGKGTDLPADQIPPPYLDTIRFDNMDELIQWVHVCNRMKG